MKSPRIGCTIDELDTPALCLDLNVLESNIRSIAESCRSHGVAWRPHSKGHKVPAIAKLQLEAGALGITCAKLGEAEVMAAAGIRDLLIANLIVGPLKLRRLAELCRHADPIVCVDHFDQIGPLSAAMAEAGVEVRALVEIDVGLGRVGVLPGEPALELARRIHQAPGIVLAGVMGYEGHLLVEADLERKESLIRDALERLVTTKKMMVDGGLPCPIISCAGTGSYLFAIQVPGVTEVQAGGAAYMDAFYREKCQVPDLEYALSVVATVVSRPTPERAIIDAGKKTMNADAHTPLVYERDDMRVKRLSAEHGELELDPSARDLKVGDRVTFIPGYGDLTTVLHDEFYGFRNGRLEVIWPIEGRGKIR